MKKIEPDVIYTVDEVAEILKLDNVTIQRMIRRGEIKAKKLGKQYRILGKNLLELFEEVMTTKK